MAAALRDAFVLSPTSTVLADTDLRGPVTVGAMSIVHPRAAILALGGPIVLGEGCIVEETAMIVNRRSETMRIGDYNVFEPGCRTAAASSQT